MIFLNIIVLVLEILYYSIFMYYAKGEGKFWRYLLLFSLMTGIMLLVNTSTIYSYLIFVVLSLYGSKYLVKVKTSLYDMLVVLVMLLCKIIIETPIYIIIKQFTDYNFYLTIPSSLFKIMLVLFANKKLNILYLKFKKVWYNNNFYIRYVFSCFTYIFVIFSIIFLIIKLGGA